MISLPAELPKVGERARLRHLVERFPHFQIEAGAEGTITEATEHLIALRMDRHVAGAEEWDNELCWTPDDATGDLDGLQGFPAVFYADAEKAATDGG